MKKFEVYATDNLNQRVALMWEGSFPEGTEDGVVLNAYAKDLGYDSYETLLAELAPSEQPGGNTVVETGDATAAPGRRK